jgi:hypothetical protein
MAAYLVRHTEDKTLLGLFVAKSLADLWDTVDEVTDPVAYEHTRLSSGALYATGEETLDSPPPFTLEYTEETEEPPVIREEGTFSLSQLAFEKAEDGRWTQFDSAFDGIGLIARIMEDLALESDTQPPK